MQVSERQSFAFVRSGRSSSQDFIRCLERRVATHRAVDHPYLRALASGRGLVDFARQYRLHSASYVQYMRRTVGALDSSGHRRVLEPHLWEELGVLGAGVSEALDEAGVDPDWVRGVPHAQLFDRFYRALDVADDPVCDAALEWRDGMIELLGSASGAVAVGAIGLATEAIVRTVYESVQTACRAHSGLSRRDAAFFELHLLAHGGRSDAFRKIAFELAETDEGRFELRRGVRLALQLRATFWDEMWLRLQDEERMMVAPRPGHGPTRRPERPPY